MVGCGSDDSESTDPAGGPSPQPAFYITAAGAGDLRNQAYDDAARFARSQGPGHALLILDFGAARRQGGQWGVSLRSGTFFSNEEVRSALQAAARGYHDEYRQGEVTIVYSNSNANLGDPGHGYETFNSRSAREAGEQQAKALRGLKLYPHESATVGGDIEPGYDSVGPPEVAIAMVDGAVSAGGKPYYDVGTAPCKAGKCINGWKVEDICQVASGGGRQALPEIYFTHLVDQPAQWAAVQKQCRIKAFAGVSSSPLGDLSPEQSLQELEAATKARVGKAIVVFPG